MTINQNKIGDDTNEYPLVIVYVLTFNTILKIYVPSVILAPIDAQGSLGVLEKIGTKEILESYLLESGDNTHRFSLDICTELQIPELKKRFIRSKKMTFEKALENVYVKKEILKGINTRMNKFLSYILDNDFLLCIDIDRRMNLERSRVKLSHDIVEPRLRFEKTNEGINYYLTLRNKNIEYYPSDKNIKIISDIPGWVLDRKKIYKLTSTNANKLKPFLLKKMVHIPERMTKEYLEKFVKDIVSKVHVNAEGFDVIKSSQKPKATLKAIKNFITDEWEVDLTFFYGRDSFQYKSPSTSLTRLNYSEGNEVIFTVVERKDEDEKDYINLLIKLGLEADGNGYLYCDAISEDPYGFVFWMQENKRQLAQNGIDCIMPNIGDKRIHDANPVLHINQVENNDWFDIEGLIRVGEHEVTFRDLIEHIKNENRIFILPNNDCFIIPIEWLHKYKSLSRWAKYDGDVVKILRSQYSLIQEMGHGVSQGIRTYDLSKSDVETTPSRNLKATLRPYQLEGVAWLVAHQQARFGCCLADDMGLGKTLQTLTALLYAKENLAEGENTAPDDIIKQMSLFESVQNERKTCLRALIVMPASLIFNWSDEINKFTSGLSITRHIGAKRTKKSRELENVDIVLTSYQTALRDVDLLKEVIWTYIVLDESQYIKNQNSKIFAAIQELTSINILSLSGTPIENSLSDLWAQMQIINPDILGTHTFFKKQFKEPIEKENDQEVLEDLIKITKPFILRRTKEEVLKDLPKKSEQIIYCEMSSEQETLYEKEKSAARNLLLNCDEGNSENKLQIVTALLRLRQLANHPVLYLKNYSCSSGKYKIITETLYTINKSGHKALVFSSFVGHLDLVSDYLKVEDISYVSLTGKTSQSKREESVTRFQKDKDLAFFLISIKAGGTGLNLTAADYILILDPWWNPFVENQAIARAHRIGLDHSLSVLRFISNETIEEKIVQLQQKKLKLSDDVLNVNDISAWNREELRYLIS
ncbi:MAG: DEAD/DEAH box helicase [Saprospiraceae bacterium]